jgi:hypothetical protein
MSLSPEEMIRDAIDVLRANRIAIDDWTVLSQSNRLVLDLEPCGLIAKIVHTSEAPRLTVELAIAAHVARAKGPGAVPASEHVYTSANVTVSLWERLTLRGEPTEPIVCSAYTDLRACFDSFVGALPDFRVAIHGAQRLAAESRLRLASTADAAFVRAVFDATLFSLRSFDWSDRVLHGDPHSGNIALTSQGPRWLEFESACAGPLEWDLSTLPQCSRGVPHDRRLLRLLVLIRRACVVAWCAARVNPTAPELEAIAHHLAVLRDESRSDT